MPGDKAFNSVKVPPYWPPPDGVVDVDVGVAVVVGWEVVGGLVVEVGGVVDVVVVGWDVVVVVVGLVVEEVVLVVEVPELQLVIMKASTSNTARGIRNFFINGPPILLIKRAMSLKGYLSSFHHIP